MKKILLGMSLLFMASTGNSQINSFVEYPIYTEPDLGLQYEPNQSRFRIWSPTAEAAEIIFYKEAINGQPLAREAMQKGEGGTWFIQVKGDLLHQFYVFRVKINGKWNREVPDPYARAVGVNGLRAQVIDLSKTNPDQWIGDKSPAFLQKTDAIIYELQIRDASISSNSGIKNKGKYLGLTETGTTNSKGLSTGIDHIADLGVTHVHLLPFFDFYSIDESDLGKPQYNWGYDPLNYNAPDGSFSTNPYDGSTRIREFKQLVQSFHQKGLRVVMDVVYNHTRLAENSYFNELVPGYYYRQDARGGFSNATACGNEIASERYMVRKFILESVLYWVKEYHLDGFRFDLMGVHDIPTMNLLSAELHKIRPDILIYGEGWTAGASPLPDRQRALKANVSKLDRIAVFSDDIRDGIKGSVFEHETPGFVSGKSADRESVKFGVMASCPHPQIDNSKVNYSKSPYSKEPYQTVTYCECHDNHTLWDKIKISAPGASEAERKNMHKLALSIVLTSQSISFLHAGTEFLRSKKGVENSFDSPDSINAIDWDLKTQNKDVYEYVKGLIQMRKEHPAFRQMYAADIRENLEFREDGDKDLVEFFINGEALGDSWKKIWVIYSGAQGRKKVQVPDGNWTIFSHNNKIEKKKKSVREFLYLEAAGCTILFQK